MTDFNSKKKFYENKDVMFDYNVLNNKSINTENQLRSLQINDNKKNLKIKD